MRVLVLSEQGARLAVRGGEFIVEKEGVAIGRVRSGEVGQVVVLGNVDVTTGARNTIFRLGIDAVFLTRTGQYRGRLVGRGHGNVDLRIAQYRQLLDPSRALVLAREFVRGKLVNQRRLLLRVQNRRPDEGRASSIVRMEHILRRLDSASGLDEIRGLEGMGASEYFGAFGGLITNPTFEFHGRNRRPPKDPVNALLSFGYALLQTVVEGAVYRAGLDPFLGALHATRHGATAMVFDLMEEFRPIFVDSVVLDLVNHRALQPTDFRRVRAGGEDVEPVLEREGWETKEGVAEEGIYLGESGRKILLRAFFRKMRKVAFYAPRGVRIPNERIIAEQAYEVARCMTDDRRIYRAYQPR